VATCRVLDIALEIHPCAFVTISNYSMYKILRIFYLISVCVSLIFEFKITFMLIKDLIGNTQKKLETNIYINTR